MFKDTLEGSTHHNKDACYKCQTCGAHGDTPEITRHCAKDTYCNHILDQVGKYERRCRFCGLTELTAGEPKSVNKSYKLVGEVNKDGSVEQLKEVDNQLKKLKALGRTKRRELRGEYYDLWDGSRNEMPRAMSISANHFLEVIKREIERERKLIGETIIGIIDDPDYPEVMIKKEILDYADNLITGQEIK